jgi:hypothetical protein
MPGRHARKYLASRSLEDLALEYVTTENSYDRPGKIYSLFDVHQEMLRRVGDEHTAAAISEAEKTFVLCGGKLLPTKNDPLALRGES